MLLVELLCTTREPSCGYTWIASGLFVSILGSHWVVLLSTQQHNGAFFLPSPLGLWRERWWVFSMPTFDSAWVKQVVLKSNHTIW